MNPHETPHSMPLVMATSLPRLPRVTPSAPKCWGTKGPCAPPDGFAMAIQTRWWAMINRRGHRTHSFPGFHQSSAVIRSFRRSRWKTSGPRSQADQRKNTCGGSPTKLRMGSTFQIPGLWDLRFAIGDWGLGNSYLVNREIRENRPKGPSIPADWGIICPCASISALISIHSVQPGKLFVGKILYVHPQLPLTTPDTLESASISLDRALKMVVISLPPVVWSWIHVQSGPSVTSMICANGRHGKIILAAVDQLLHSCFVVGAAAAVILPAKIGAKPNIHVTLWDPPNERWPES